MKACLEAVLEKVIKRVMVVILYLWAVPNPGVDIGANPCVKLVAGALANPRSSPRPKPRHIAAGIIHMSASIRRILIHAAGKC